MKERNKTYAVEWTEIITYYEEVKAENENDALIISGAEPQILDSDISEGSLKINQIHD